MEQRFIKCSEDEEFRKVLVEALDSAKKKL